MRRVLPHDDNASLVVDVVGGSGVVRPGSGVERPAVTSMWEDLLHRDRQGDAVRSQRGHEVGEQSQRLGLEVTDEWDRANSVQRLVKAVFERAASLTQNGRERTLLIERAAESARIAAAAGQPGVRRDHTWR